MDKAAILRSLREGRKRVKFCPGCGEELSDRLPVGMDEFNPTFDCAHSCGWSGDISPDLPLVTA